MTLEPLTVLHADESFPHWQDNALYRFVPADPPESADALRARYSVLSRGGSSDESEQWLNWFMREPASGELIGMIECTLFADKTAQLAYFVFAKHQRSGFAFEGCAAVLGELKTHWGATLAQAYIDTRNAASIATPL